MSRRVVVEAEAVRVCDSCGNEIDQDTPLAQVVRWFYISRVEVPGLEIPWQVREDLGHDACSPTCLRLLLEGHVAALVAAARVKAGES